MLRNSLKPFYVREYTLKLGRSSNGEYVILEGDDERVSKYIDLLKLDKKLIPYGMDCVIVNLRETFSSISFEVKPSTTYEERLDS
ncbi:MAG: hypothetical protein KatS3mg078_0924 [Deltaproteobacteria bacterium]|jgi:hypothetical protein|nr:MAG: hypothetical protein KatS3mg078_0924 [Deltaproteobacteria bacterium]